MGRLTYNSNRFTKVDKYDPVSNAYNGLQVATKINQKNGQDYKLVDIIDVDFDKVWFAPTYSYITNAEEFFDAIEHLDSSYDISNLSNEISIIKNSYLTKDEFNSIIGQYQGALNYGDHIKVVDNNTLIAYDVISNSQLYEFSTSYVSHEYLTENVYTKTQTVQTVEDKIRELIGGADEKFDTLQEISEWIMDQTTFKEVSNDEVDFSSGKKYYHINAQTGKYESVTEEYFNEHQDEQYYVVASLTEEIQNINDKIGYAEYNPQSNVWTYTGLLKEIDDLHTSDNNIIRELVTIDNQIREIRSDAEFAVERSYYAYELAYASTIIANLAYETANSEIEKSDIAYEIAKYAYEAVGVKSYDGYYRSMTESEISSLNPGDMVFTFNADSGTYVKIAYYPYNTGIDYLIYVEPVEATGFHKTVEELSYLTYTSLYRLDVDNSYAMPGYVTLSMSPQSYEGDMNRTIYMNVTQTDYSLNDLLIHKDGMITAYQMNEILSFVTGWENISNWQ